MSGLFATRRMAAAYAQWRPAVHPHVIDIIVRRLGRVHRVLDVGCGTGLSTVPLSRLADQVIGLEPAEVMLHWSAQVAPEAMFIAARAEAVPLRSASVDVITAAGSLNYVDLELFVPEALRLLRPAGTLVTYDFGPGREFRDSPALADWYAEFERRWPWPAPRLFDVARPPLNGVTLRLLDREDFETVLRLEPQFYLEYAMTETNVESAIAAGQPEAAIRRWCAETLPCVFAAAARDVVFRGYIAYTRNPEVPQ
jgi:SAM-dependent methyltransferase